MIFSFENFYFIFYLENILLLKKTQLLLQAITERNYRHTLLDGATKILKRDGVMLQP